MLEDPSTSQRGRGSMRASASNTPVPPRAWRQRQVPSSSWTALWRMPRRKEATDRWGWWATVRSRRASKLGKVLGPRTKALTAWDFSGVTPGVMSTSTRARTSSGRWPASARAVRPPSDMPTTTRAAGASWATASATSSAFEATSAGCTRASSAWPWPGRSRATRGRSSTRATESHVWAFWAPPCSRTSSGGAVPHTKALKCRPWPTGTGTRRTGGRWPVGRPSSAAFSASKPNSS